MVTDICRVQLSDNWSDTRPKLVVIDDLMCEAWNNSITDLFIKGSHHYNLSVIFIIQNIFHQGRGQRDISQNANYILIFKNPRVRPENSNFLQEVHHDTTSKPYGYFLIYLKQTTLENCRFRKCVYPSDPYQYVYILLKPIKTASGTTRVPVVRL